MVFKILENMEMLLMKQSIKKYWYPHENEAIW